MGFRLPTVFLFSGHLIDSLNAASRMTSSENCQNVESVRGAHLWHGSSVLRSGDRQLLTGHSMAHATRCGDLGWINPFPFWGMPFFKRHAFGRFFMNGVYSSQAPSVPILCFKSRQKETARPCESARGGAAKHRIASAGQKGALWPEFVEPNVLAMD